MKTLSSIKLAQRALATEAKLLAEQQQVLLLGKDVRDFMHLSKKDLLNLILGIRRNYQQGKCSTLLYKLLLRAVLDRLVKRR
jgi:hypothetical protein